MIFDSLVDNKSFFEIIEQKKMDIINDTDINKYLEKHPSMDKSSLRIRGFFYFIVVLRLTLIKKELIIFCLCC